MHRAAEDNGDRERIPYWKGRERKLYFACSHEPKTALKSKFLIKTLNWTLKNIVKTMYSDT